MLTKGLHKSIEQILDVSEMNISFKKNHLNSDGSFVYFEKKFASKEKVVNQLLSLQWIEKVSFENQYLNFWLSESLLTLTSEVFPKVKFVKPLRMYQLRNRLNEEIITKDFLYPEHWRPLIKTYNLCVIELLTFNSLSKNSIDELFKTFKRLDLGYMYRRDSSELLKGLFYILDDCITLIERTCDE